MPQPASKRLVTEADLSDPTSAAGGVLVATYASLARLAWNPDLLVVGTITRDANGAATGSAVRWPDGSDGTYAGIPSLGTPGAVDAYTITYEGPDGTVTYTQPAVTRDASGAVTARPEMTVD